MTSSYEDDKKLATKTGELAAITPALLLEKEKKRKKAARHQEATVATNTRQLAGITPALPFSRYKKIKRPRQVSLYYVVL